MAVRVYEQTFIFFPASNPSLIIAQIWFSTLLLVWFILCEEGLNFGWVSQWKTTGTMHAALCTTRQESTLQTEQDNMWLMLKHVPTRAGGSRSIQSGHWRTKCQGVANLWAFARLRTIPSSALQNRHKKGKREKEQHRRVQALSHSLSYSAVRMLADRTCWQDIVYRYIRKKKNDKKR